MDIDQSSVVLRQNINVYTLLSKYSDTSANEDNSFRNHIR